LLIDKHGYCRIGDFGSSKFIEGTTPWTGGVVGSVQYAAPELYDNPPYSSKIDVFAFGLILYEILVGHPVFDPKLDPVRLMFLVLTNRRADLPDAMPEAMKTLIKQCWAEDPDDRPSFHDILSELERIQFQIHPQVKWPAVKEFLADIRSSPKQNST
jgi:serine/threonine protein kinase